jgi:hypothetical protein
MVHFFTFIAVLALTLTTLAALTTLARSAALGATPEWTATIA